MAEVTDLIWNLVTISVVDMQLPDLELIWLKKNSLGSAQSSSYSNTRSLKSSDGITNQPSVHKKASDKQYSKFTLFIAPEFVYFVQPLTNDYSAVYDGDVPHETTYYIDDLGEEPYPIEYYPRIDYGARAGIGIGMFDVFAGYRVVSQTFYFGLTWNLSKK